jgi:hypothetical protein
MLVVFSYGPRPASGGCISSISCGPAGLLEGIAAYLGRSVRTVQRWEREEGLPVHRLAHEKRATVYGDPEELTRWWASRRMALADSIPAEGDAPPLDEPGQAIDGLSVSDRSQPRVRRELLVAAIALSAILAIFGLHLWSQVSTRRDADAGSTQHAPSERPRSTPRLERLTNTFAATGRPALSSDGRMLAYVSDGGQDAPRRRSGCNRSAVRRCS